MEKNKIETPFAIIKIVRRSPVFTGRYDFVLKSSRQDDDAKLFALGIGKDYYVLCSYLKILFQVIVKMN